MKVTAARAASVMPAVTRRNLGVMDATPGENKRAHKAACPFKRLAAFLPDRCAAVNGAVIAQDKSYDHLAFDVGQMRDLTFLGGFVRFQKLFNVNLVARAIEIAEGRHQVA